MIRVEGISKRFGETVAVAGAAFTANDGDLTYLLGPNGAGKSTVLRLIAGLTAADSGNIIINGRPRDDLSQPMGEIGFSFGAQSMNPSLTAAANLRWQATLGGAPVSSVDRLLSLVGLASVADRKVGGFSLGMLQRLGIAAALLGEPHTLVLDEPANGLDVEGILWLRDLLLRIAAQGRCLLVASHNLPEVELTGTRVVIMGRGEVVANTSVRSIIEQGSGPRRLEAAYLALTRQTTEYRGDTERDSA